VGFGLVIGFIDHIQIVTTSNYNTITNSHNQQFTTAHTKSSQSAVSSPVVNLQPLGEVVHGNYELLMSCQAVWKGSCDINRDPLKWCASVTGASGPGSGLGGLACCAGVTLLAPRFNSDSHI
jgi:hypothetical protein